MIDGQELDYLKESFKKQDMRELSTDPTWLRAFATYNTLNKPRLSLNCRGCYIKVYLYNKKLYEQPINR